MDYLLLALACPVCGDEFAVFTDLSNHHLASHERALHGAPVDAHPARWVATSPVERAQAWNAYSLDGETPTLVITVLGALQVQCHEAGVPWDAAQARALLGALGVPAEAPAHGEWQAGIQEALARLGQGVDHA